MQGLDKVYIGKHTSCSFVGVGILYWIYIGFINIWLLLLSSYFYPSGTSKSTNLLFLENLKIYITYETITRCKVKTHVWWNTFYILVVQSSLYYHRMNNEISPALNNVYDSSLHDESKYITYFFWYCKKSTYECHYLLTTKRHIIIAQQYRILVMEPST